MGIELIRKNNRLSVTAYQDSVLFYLNKGANGVIPSVGTQFKATWDTQNRNIRIDSGMGVIYGRQFEIPEGDTEIIDLNGINNIVYITVWIEIDLRDPTEQKVSIQTRSATNGYYYPDAGDNLISNPYGVARMELYRFIYYPNTRLDTATVFKVLRNDWIANADYASNSNQALTAPTVDVSDSSTNIANTQWVKNYLGFSEGGLLLSNIGLGDTFTVQTSRNYVCRLRNKVMIELKISSILTKFGQELRSTDIWGAPGYAIGIGKLPALYRPSIPKRIILAQGSLWVSGMLQGGGSNVVTIEVQTDGSISMTGSFYDTTLTTAQGIKYQIEGGAHLPYEFNLWFDI